MKLRKAQIIALSTIALIVILYFIFLWDVGKVYENIGDSLNIPVKSIKTLSLGNDEYILYYSPGSAFSSREWWVKKNGKLIFNVNSSDGQVDDLKIKNGKPYLIGLGVNNVDLSKENYK